MQKYVKLALGFSELAIEALKDVTYLNGRPAHHPDHKTFDYKRVTLKLVCRDEFHKMNQFEQEAYVYRLAK